jgi:hypothetical protein
MGPEPRVGDAISAEDDGIRAQAFNGNVIVTTLAANATNASATGGTIEAGSGGSDQAIYAESAEGDVSVYQNAGLSGYQGIVASAEDGTVIVDVNAGIEATDFGVYADVDDSDGTGGGTGAEIATVTVGPNGSIESGGSSIVVAGDDGLVTVDVSGSLEQTSTSSTDYNGISITTDSGAIDVTTRDGGTITTAATGIDTNGIRTATEEGAITIVVGDQISTVGDGIDARSEEGDITITTLAADALQGTILDDADASGLGGKIIAGVADFDAGIDAFSDGGDVSITVNAIIEADDGIIAGSDRGDVTVNVNADINAEDFGVYAYIETDAGSEPETEIVRVTVAADATITSSEDGIFVEGDSGDATVIVNGRVDSAGETVDGAEEGDGVDIRTGAGSIFMTLNAATGDNLGGIRADQEGILLESDFGNVTVTINEDITAGQSALDVTDGEVVIVNINGGTLTGAGSDGEAVVEVAADVSIEVNNSGVIHSNAETDIEQAADLAVDLDADDGTLDSSVLTNNGTIIGRINGSLAADRVENNSSESWVFTGVSNFLGGDDTLNNNSTGLIRNAVDAEGAETAEYVSLESFNNAGLLTLSDQSMGQDFLRDRAYTDGDFTGLGGTLAIDADLGASNPDADRLLIGSRALEGTTYVDVNLVSSEFGGLNEAGIPVVAIGTAEGSIGSFMLSNGPIDMGLFTYDLYYRTDLGDLATGNDEGQGSLANTGFDEGTAGVESVWVLASSPDADAFALPMLQSTVHTLWHESAGTWDERTADLRRNPQGGDMTVSSMSEAGATQKTGAWIKLYGGKQDQDFSYQSMPPAPSSPSTINDNMDLRYHGFTTGLDVTVDADVPGDVILGVLVGYGKAGLDFASGSSADYETKTFGLYATYMNDGFFIDALFKADMGTVDYATQTSVGAATFSTDYKALGFVLDTGKRYNLTGGTFIEPKATLSYSRSSVDSAIVAGAPVAFDDGSSTKGRIGARFGTQQANSEAFVELSLWKEFSGDQTVFIDSGNGASITQQPGDTYGEVAVGVNLFDAGNGWNAFAKGGATFGGDTKAYSAQAGFRVNF